MRLFLGIDGGGTKTETLICDEEGNIIGRYVGAPSNPLFTEKSKLMETIRESAGSAFQDIGGDKKIEYAAVCIPGIKLYKSEVESEYLKYCKKVGIFGDDLNAFYSALLKPYGIIVLSGTGSFALGINREGKKHKLGGWGPILGDEGSGYFIGILCLKSVIKEYEETGLKTTLTPKVLDFFGIKEVTELRKKVYSEECNRSIISSLSKIVHESARDGDVVAIEIINNAAKHLAEYVRVIVEKLNMYDKEYDVVLTGGISNFGELILKPFTEEVKKISDCLNVGTPKLRPAVGSLLVAMIESGINIESESILKNLHDSYKKYMINS
ncbi:MAG: hypothetical protein HPY74_00680 [Firmicutes bacterium]|nr:hypothetical protein [Bacillota bacterium]